MRSLIEFFKAGKVYNSRDSVKFVITKYKDLTEIVIPFFDKYKIIGVKTLDFSDWCEVVKLMKNKTHLTSEGLNKIILIKSGMNKRRKYNKQNDL